MEYVTLNNGVKMPKLCTVSETLNQNGIDTDIFWIGNVEYILDCRKDYSWLIK